MAEDTPGVVDVAEEHRFRYVEDGLEAELVYRARDGVLTLVHTGVPDALGGRGIGGRLVQAAMARARSRGEVVVPRCPYARSWLEKHPDEAAGVTIDWEAAGTRPPSA